MQHVRKNAIELGIATLACECEKVDYFVFIWQMKNACYGRFKEYLLTSYEGKSLTNSHYVTHKLLEFTIQRTKETNITFFLMEKWLNFVIKHCNWLYQRTPPPR